MTPPPQTAPSFDRLDERTKTHEKDIDELKLDISAIRKDLADVKAILSEAKGGWRMLLLVGGAGGLIGATLTKYAPWLAFGGSPH